MKLYIKIIAVAVFLFVLGVSAYTYITGGVEDHQTATDAYYDASIRAKPISVSLSLLEANNCVPGREYLISGYITGMTAPSQTGQTQYILSDSILPANSFPLISTKSYIPHEAVSLSAICIAKYSPQIKGYSYALFE